MNTLHTLSTLLQQSDTSLAILCLVLGLFVGSFLNVVIHRLPKMLERQWKKDCQVYLELEQGSSDKETYNLLFPPSHCPSCKTPVRAWQNIPVISYLLLGGKCKSCSTKISLLYPIIELITGLLTACVALQFGFSWQTVFAILFCWSLVALTVIDLDTQLLPDSITLPLLWLGLLINTQNLFTDLNSAVWGAVAGYLSLWLIFWGFKLLTGKEGMGYGDFKLLAAFGAWFGWPMLLPIILLASLSGTVIGLALIFSKNLLKDQAIAFGPYLAAGGLLSLFFGEQLLTLFGLG